MSKTFYEKLEKPGLINHDSAKGYNCKYKL